MAHCIASLGRGQTHTALGRLELQMLTVQSLVCRNGPDPPRLTVFDSCPAPSPDAEASSPCLCLILLSGGFRLSQQ